MLAITNFNPIQSINSLLQPLGLTLSNKQQIVNKIALAAFAVLTFSYAPQMADALCPRGNLHNCVTILCGPRIPTDGSYVAYHNCVVNCANNCHL